MAAWLGPVNEEAEIAYFIRPEEDHATPVRFVGSQENHCEEKRKAAVHFMIPLFSMVA